jgi:hypothetical protein
LYAVSCLATASLLGAPDAAFLIPEARCGQAPCAWFVLLLETNGESFVPRGLPPERVLPNGECYVRAAERLDVPAGELRLTARYGQWRATPARLTLAPGEEKKTLFALVLPALAATVREIVYVRTELPPSFIATAEQCEFERVRSDARTFDPAKPAFDRDGIWVVAPEVRLSAFTPAYFAALAEGRLPIVIAENAARVTPYGWDASPATRRTIVAGAAGRLPEVGPGSAGISEGPAIVLAADRVPAAGQTIGISAKKTVRLHATAWDACGLTRLEIRDGMRAALTTEAATPQNVLQLEGDVVLVAPSFLIAYARSANGDEALSGVVRVVPEKTRAHSGIVPLCDWTSPHRTFGIQFRVTASAHVADTLLVRAREGAHAAPPEMPLSLRKGDAVTLAFTLALPDRREFPAHVPVTLATSAGAVSWDGTILVSPWDLDTFRPDGAPTLMRQETRIGFKLGALTLRALRPIAKPRALVVEVFGEGWNDAAIAITLQGLPPRQALVLVMPIPARRGWHTIEFNPAGYRIAAGVALTVEARAPGIALLGGLRVLE